MMEPIELEFSTNWNNKLNCTVFTSIRLKGAKYQVGNTYAVKLQKGVNNGVPNWFPMKLVKCISISEFRLHELKEWVARLDTGYGKTECTALIKRMYSKSNINWDEQILVCILLKTIS